MATITEIVDDETGGNEVKNDTQTGTKDGHTKNQGSAVQQ